jgi:hypothetical protein
VRKSETGGYEMKKWTGLETGGYEMKKWTVGLIAVLSSAGLALAAIENNVYTGNAGDNNFNNNANWWNAVTPNDAAFFRGDNIAANPAWANVNLSAPVTISAITYQGTELASAAYNIGGANTLTIDGNPEARTLLIEVANAVTANQTISANLVLSSYNDANNAHIKTGSGGGGLILSGNVSQAAGSHGVGIFVGKGDVELSGTVNGSGKLWKVSDNAGGAGVLKVTGAWSGGTLQIATATAVHLNHAAADSTALAGLFLQLVGGDLVLENDEQIGDSVNLTFGAAVAGTFDLGGQTETISGLQFGAASGQSGILDMGAGGILHLLNQNSAANWGTLTVTNWSNGSDFIFVDGGSFSTAQLGAINFDGYGTGAQVLEGKLVPTAIPEPTTVGLFFISACGILAARRMKF